MNPAEIHQIETELLLDAAYRRYGYDFRGYARVSVTRRLLHRVEREGLRCIAELIPRLLYDRKLFDSLIKDMALPVTRLFRNPCFFRALRQHVIPILRTYPFVKVWHPGCGTGEEAYSMAIVLHEEELLQRTRIYATDINPDCLETAQDAIYALDSVRGRIAAYERSGGKASLLQYCHESADSVRFRKLLRDRITFAPHNLATDQVFGEMNLVVCRNVLIYFSDALRDRVLGLLTDSLCHRGFLCLGARETLRATAVADSYACVDRENRVYRKA